MIGFFLGFNYQLRLIENSQPQLEPVRLLFGGSEKGIPPKRHQKGSKSHGQKKTWVSAMNVPGVLLTSLKRKIEKKHYLQFLTVMYSTPSPSQKKVVYMYRYILVHRKPCIVANVNQSNTSQSSLAGHPKRSIQGVEVCQGLRIFCRAGNPP